MSKIMSSMLLAAGNQRYHKALPRSLIVFFAYIFASCGAVLAQYIPMYPARPTSAECTAYAEASYAVVKAASDELTKCQQRDGGTVTFQVGRYMPDCQERAQAYLSCTAVQNRWCATLNAHQTKTAECRRDAAVADRQRSEEQRQADLTASRRKTAREAYEHAKEAFQIQSEGRVKHAKISAAQAAQAAARDAAISYGTENAQNIPILNEIGSGSSLIFTEMPFNPIVQEIGDVSSAAARARMGDALGKMNRAMGLTGEIGAAVSPLPTKAQKDFANAAAIAASASDERIKQDERKKIRMLFD